MIHTIVRIDLTLEENLPNLLSDSNQEAITFHQLPQIHVWIPQHINTEIGLPKRRVEDLRRAVLMAFSARMSGLNEMIGHQYSSYLQGSNIDESCSIFGHNYRYYVAPRETDIFEKNGEYEICIKCWKVRAFGTDVYSSDYLYQHAQTVRKNWTERQRACILGDK